MSSDGTPYRYSFSVESLTENGFNDAMQDWSREIDVDVGSVSVFEASVRTADRKLTVPYHHQIPHRRAELRGHQRRWVSMVLQATVLYSLRVSTCRIDISTLGLKDLRRAISIVNFSAITLYFETNCSSPPAS